MLDFSTLHQKSCRYFNIFYHRVENFARFLNKKRMSANMLTLAGLGFAVLGLNFLALENYFLAFLCLVLNRLCDVLDGAVARFSHISTFGIFFDIFADYAAAALLIWGFILGNEAQNAAAGAFYLVGLNLSGVALLALSAISKQDYVALNKTPFKVCLWGAIQNADIFTALTLMCLLPFWFMPIAIFFGLLLFGKTLLIISGAYWTLKIKKQN